MEKKIEPKNEKGVVTNPFNELDRDLESGEVAALNRMLPVEDLSETQLQAEHEARMLRMEKRWDKFQKVKGKDTFRGMGTTGQIEYIHKRVTIPVGVDVPIFLGLIRYLYFTKRYRGARMYESALYESDNVKTEIKTLGLNHDKIRAAIDQLLPSPVIEIPDVTECFRKANKQGWEYGKDGATVNKGLGVNVDKAKIEVEIDRKHILDNIEQTKKDADPKTVLEHMRNARIGK